MNLKQWAVYAIWLAIATSSLSAVGFTIGYFRVSVPMLCLYAASVLSLFYWRDNSGKLAFLAVLFSYLVVITITRFPLEYAIKPIGAVGLMMLATLVRPLPLTRESIFRAMSISMILNVIVNLANLVAFYRAGIASPHAYLGPLFIGNGFIIRFDLLRMQGVFSEPAHHSIYLVFVLFVFYYFGYLQSGKKIFRYSIVAATIVLLMFSFSMSGYLLMLTIVGVMFFFGRMKLKAKLSIVATLAVLMVFAWFHPGTKRASYGRVAVILDSFHGVSMEDGNWDSGRTAPVQVMFEYVQEEGVVGFLIGEGYGNFEWWLATTYAGLTTTMARGQIPNLTAGLFLGSGVIGVSLFYGYFYALFCDLRWRDQLIFYIYLQVLFFAYGIIVNTTLWGMLIVYRLLHDARRREFQFPQNHVRGRRRV
jgi:hypothetical protein